MTDIDERFPDKESLQKAKELMYDYKMNKTSQAFGHLAMFAMDNNFEMVDKILKGSRIPLTVVKSIATIFCQDAPHPMHSKEYEKVRVRFFYELCSREEEVEALKRFLRLNMTKEPLKETEIQQHKSLIEEMETTQDFIDYIADMFAEVERKQDAKNNTKH